MGWQELADAVIARRVELGHHTRDSFVAASGLSPRTLGDIETARRTSYSKSTLARLERGLKWTDGQVARHVNGQAGPSSHFDEIGRAIARDDFVLRWLLGHSGLNGADELRVVSLIRAEREAWEREYLWPAVAARIVELGGVVYWPWDDQA